VTTGYDAVDVSALPPGGDYYLAYIDGDYITLPAVRAKFPTARILTVTTTGKLAADICDVESGDARPAIAAAGVRAGLYNTVYSDVSTKPELDTAMGDLDWQWYAANPTGEEHLVPDSVATQWAWPGHGSTGNYDISTTNGVYPNTPPPLPEGVTMADVAVFTNTQGEPEVYFVSEAQQVCALVRSTSNKWTPYNVSNLANDTTKVAS